MATHAVELAPARLPQRRTGRAVLLAAWVAGAVLFGALAGWLLGHPHVTIRTAPPAARPQTLRGLGPLRVAVDARWTPVAATGPLADGLPGAQAFAVDGREAFVARVPALTASLLPASLLRVLDAAPAEPVPDTVDGRPAWTYEGLATRRGEAVEITVVPTTRGALVLACTGRWSIAGGCAQGVAGLAGAQALRPSPRLAARRVVPPAVAALDATRRSGAREMRAASTAAGQAHVARRVARAHRRAIPALTAALARPGLRRRATAALTAEAAAYGRLANAAAARSPRWYARETARLTRTDARLRATLAQLPGWG
jgi:hypothetical protein